MTIIPILFCRARVNLLLQEAKSKVVKKIVYIRQQKEDKPLTDPNPKKSLKSQSEPQNVIQPGSNKGLKYVGAGVLPYFIRDNETYFVVGKEAFGRPHNKNKLSDFGGLADPNEIPLKTAVREFTEETRGVFGDEKAIQGALKTAQFVERKGYFSYFLKVPPLSDQEFSRLRERFTLVSSQQKLSSAQLEKSKLLCIKASEVFKAATGRLSQKENVNEMTLEVEGTKECLRPSFGITLNQNRAAIMQIIK